MSSAPVGAIVYLFEADSIEHLAQGVLEQLIALLHSTSRVADRLVAGHENIAPGGE